jgi:hypothetical protein
MCLEARLDAPCLPIPENNITFTVPAADPFPVRRESNLASVTCDGVTRETFLAVLPEVVSTIY